MTFPIEILKDNYKDKTGYIIGRGLSLLNLTREHIKQGSAIITINTTLFKARELKLGDKCDFFCMQKDGNFQFDGVHHDIEFYKNSAQKPCPHGKCKKICGTIVAPELPEKLLIHEYNSKYCYEDYQERYIFNNENFGLQWLHFSVLSAIYIMKVFGISDLKMVSLDSYTHNDNRGVKYLDSDFQGDYSRYKAGIDEHLEKCKFNSVEFITPQKE
jgi:hypothetical protein